jgi:hypothetical protein
VASSCASSPPLPWINGTAFPNTPTATVFWSATPNAGSSTNATALWFKDGSTQTFDRGTGFYVRLVRGGRAFGMLAPALQAPSFNFFAPRRYNGNTMLSADTSGYSGNPASFGVSFGPCTVFASGLLIAPPSAPVGSFCVITLNQYGHVANGQNYAQATEVQLNITISQALQTLGFAAPPGVSVGGTDVGAATSDQNLTPVTFTSLTPGVCTVSGTNGSTVTGVAAGRCTIRASQSGNTNYLSATADMSFGIASAAVICNLHMDDTNPMLATKEGLILLRAMLSFTGTAVTNGTGLATPCATIRADLNTKCGTAFQ